MLKFKDGMAIDTSGELRIIEKSDGLYVVGKGYCVAVDSRKKGGEIIHTLKSKQSNRQKL